MGGARWARCRTRRLRQHCSGDGARPRGSRSLRTSPRVASQSGGGVDSTRESFVRLLLLTDSVLDLRAPELMSKGARPIAEAPAQPSPNIMAGTRGGFAAAAAPGTSG